MLGVPFLIKLQASGKTLAQMFPCEFWEVSKETFHPEHLWKSVSILTLTHFRAMFLFYIL